MTYYVTSWSFYGSFLMQMALIWACSFAILKTWVNVIFGLGIAMFVPAWILMNIHMKLIRDQSIERINQIKKGRGSMMRTDEFIKSRQLLLH